MAAIEAPSLASEAVAQIGSFEIRNTMVMAWLAMAVFLVLGLLLRRTKYKEVPGRFQTFMEMIVEGLFDFFDSVVGDRERTRKFFPLVATIFLFLVLANWMGILPGVGSITIQGLHEGHLMNIPLFRSMNADVNMTLAIAIVSVVMTQVFGIAALGVLPYAGKYFVAPWRDPIMSFVGILELIAEFAKVVSFTFRLFGNIFAGEILLGVAATLLVMVTGTEKIWYAIPGGLIQIPFMALELLVGLIQAFIFSTLTLVFISMFTVHQTVTRKEEH